ADALGLSRFLPAPARQRASLAAWKQLFAAPQALREAFSQTGLPPALVTHLETGWHKADKTLFDASDLFQAAPALKRFVIPTEHGAALLATVFSQHNPDNAALAAAGDAPGVRYVQPLSRINDSFSQIRVR